MKSKDLESSLESPAEPKIGSLHDHSHTGSKSNSNGKLEEIELAIDGMTCASCVRRVENALSKVPGVESAAVSLTAKAAFVHAKGDVSVHHLEDAVKNVGYKAHLSHSDHDSGDMHMGHDSENNGEHASHDHSSHDHMAMIDNEGKANPFSFWIMIAITIIVLGVGMFWSNRPTLISILMMVLSAIVVFGYGKGIFRGAYHELKAKSPGMDSLIVLGASAAWISGVAEFVKNPRGALDFEAASAIMAFQLIGRRLELRARNSMTSSIESLLNKVPKTAMRLTGDGQESEISIDKLVKDDLIRVRAGETIAADGIVTEGESTVNESMLTGETMPIAKQKRSQVFQGAIVGEGSLIIRVEKAGKGATLDRIAQAVRRAQASKAPIQRLADRITAWFVPIVVVLAVATLVGNLAFGHGWQDSMLIAISVVVVSCPCALGLATPAAIAVASGKGAELGILFRDGAAIEAATSLEQIMVDKTGTLTRGVPTVTLVEVVEMDATPDSKSRFLDVIAAAESGSTHPIATAILDASKDRLKSSKFKSFVGQGVQATVSRPLENEVEEIEVFAGTQEFLTSQGISVPNEWLVKAQAHQQEGQTTIFGAVNGKFAGLISVADEINPDSKQSIQWLRDNHKAVTMLTGDNEAVARSIAKNLGIDEFFAQVKPEDKLNYVQKSRQKLRTAMVGDGINDAPALAAADLGIAIGKGSDAAIGASGVTLLRPGFGGVVDALRLGQATQMIIKQNLAWAFGYNLLMIPLAMSGRVDPMIASAAMAVSSLSVVLNSLRLKLFRSIF